MLKPLALTATILLLLAGAARAALPIELEVAAQSDAPFGALQEWNKVLAEMDLARVRLRGASGGEQVQLRVTGEGTRKRYIVAGLLNRQDQLVLPGGKFGSGDRAGLKQYFETLPARHEEAGIERGRFGLTKEQFEHVFNDLSSEVTEPTLDGSPHELVPALTREFALPVRGSGATQAALRAAPPFRSQMKGLSTGTALAAVLRAAGLQFVPKKLGADPLTLRVSKLDSAAESWPVGWKPLGTPRQTAPAMYRVTNIEIENFTLDKALAALASHMAVPLVLDQHTLAERKIDPAKIQARIPRTKTFVRHAVDGVLARGKLAGELRVDDAGQPFYWITQFGKDSPRATEVERASAPQ
jgi:hypothetical protein